MSVPQETFHKCSRCWREARLGQRYCWECHAAYIREWRRAHALNAVQRLKSNARRLANHHADKGHIQRLLCEVCLSPDTQPHHDDYSKPLEVRWFCREHHLAHEGKQMRKASIDRYDYEPS